jgi:LysR family transcriptional regulator of abg operon
VCNARQFIVAREGHPVISNPTARALVEYEWLYTAPIVDGDGNRQAAMFAAAGVKIPERLMQCETLAALTLLRNTDVIGICPERLLGHPESRGIVAVPTTQLHPCEIEIALLAPSDVPLTPAAEYFAHCLKQSISA